MQPTRPCAHHVVRSRYIVIRSRSADSKCTRDPHQRREGGATVRGERLVDPDVAQASLAVESGHAVRAGDVVERGADEAAIARVRIDECVQMTGERIAALEAVEPEREKGREAGLETDPGMDRGSAPSASRESEKAPEPKSLDRDLSL